VKNIGQKHGAEAVLDANKGDFTEIKLVIRSQDKVKI
jgi:hypothetical protein